MRSWEFVDDAWRRAAARSLHRLVLWLLPAALLLCACAARGAAPRGAARSLALPKMKHDDEQPEPPSPPPQRRQGRWVHSPPPLRAALRQLPPPLRAWLLRPRHRAATALLALGLLCLLARAARWWSARARARTCLPVPPYAMDALLLDGDASSSEGQGWRRADGNGTRRGGARHRGGGAAGGAEAVRFVLLWSTGPDSFSLRPRRCLESIFYHHPNAQARAPSPMYRRMHLPTSPPHLAASPPPGARLRQ